MKENAQRLVLKFTEPTTSIVYSLLPESYLLDSERDLIKRITEQATEGGFEEVGRGGDMIAISRPDLNYVIKFSYDDSNVGLRQYFPDRIAYGFLVAKECLGGLFAPSIDIPFILEDRERNQYSVSSVVQQKVRTVAEVGGMQGEFVELTQRMWERGVLDRDPCWEENYGILPSGELVLIDFGDLSTRAKDFLYYEGLPRKGLYEPSLRDTFRISNFRKIFGKNPKARTYAPTVIL